MVLVLVPPQAAFLTLDHLSQHDPITIYAQVYFNLCDPIPSGNHEQPTPAASNAAGVTIGSLIDQFLRRKRFGFTLLDLLSVVVIIGILAATALIVLGKQKARTYQALMLNDVHNYALVAETGVGDGGYILPEHTPGFKYSTGDSTLGFSTSGSSWALIVTNQNTETTCGAQAIVGMSIKPSCGTPVAGGIVASPDTPAAGETVVYTVSGYLAQVAAASSGEGQGGPSGGVGERSSFSLPTILAASDYSNATLIGWDFGDGTTQSGPPSTNTTVTHTYAVAGDYLVKVGIISKTGVTFSASLKEKAAAGSPGGNQMPAASFSVSSNPVIVGLIASFDASASTDEDGSVSSYAWSFGDGGTATGVSPTHVYADAGSFTVTLMVTDNQGGTNAIQQGVVAVLDSSYIPSATFSVNPSSNLSTGITANFSAHTDPNITTYRWDFGDGNIGSGATASHSYSTSGTFTARLTTTASNNNTGTTTQPITITAPATGVIAMAGGTSGGNTIVGRTNTFGFTSSLLDISSYSWTFGDGGESSAQAPTHAFTGAQGYTVSVTAINASNSATATLPVVVAANQPPTAAFTSNPQNPSLGQLVTFDASTSGDSDGSISSYAWDFGDATLGSGVTATHSYSGSNSFTVMLTVTDDLGASTSVSHPVTTNSAPTAEFSLTDAVPTGTDLGITNASMDPDAGQVLTYAWNFGDGSASTVATPSKSFSSPGSFTVTLTVTDPYGLSDTVSHQVSASNRPPVTPAVSCTPTSAPSGSQVTCTAAATDPDGGTVSYTWSSTGKVTSSGGTATYSQGTPGSLAISATASDGQGGTSSAGSSSVSFTNFNPTGSFSVDATVKSTGTDFTFTPTASDPDGGTISYSWDFGDGVIQNSSTNAPLSHSYSTPGSYGVTMMVSDGQGGSFTTVAQTLTATNQAPVVASIICTPQSTLAPGQSITCSVAASDPDGTVAKYYWLVWRADVGNGVMVSVTNTSSTFSWTPPQNSASDGMYTVYVQAIDNLGLGSVGRGDGLSPNVDVWIQFTY